MNKIYCVHYYLVNDAYGCFSWYKSLDSAERAFSQMKSNGNYQKAVLFDKNGKKLNEFIR